jgi:hypothetical protein
MTWVAEVDEPFAVRPLRELPKQTDPTLVVLDQVVVRREDGCDLALSLEVGYGNRDLLQALSGYPRNCRLGCDSRYRGSPYWTGK